MHRLWDFETLRIREGDEMHEVLKDEIESMGEKYKVELPWKEGHSKVPSNYKK